MTVLFSTSVEAEPLVLLEQLGFKETLEPLVLLDQQESLDQPDPQEQQDRLVRCRLLTHIL